MGRHFDSDGDGLADQGQPDIGDLENETIFVPVEEHHDDDDQATMMMGRDEENDLRDPWFHTEEGRAWLAARGEADS